MGEVLKDLQEIGLDQKEAQIYLAILNLGKGTVSDISRKAYVKRTTIYEYIEKLIEKGLVIKTVEKKRIQYLAENPQKLAKIIERKKRKVESVLPSLSEIYSKVCHKPVIKFYEGIRGIRKMYEELTCTSYTIYGTFSIDKYFNHFTERDNEEFFANIKKSGGKIKDLVEDTPNAREYVKRHINQGVGNSKFLPKDFKIEMDLMVCGNKVGMISQVNLIGIIIENKEIADYQRNFIKLLRKTC
ncbi:TrmB family transcriptional regulator [Patescibacteria group bacterium]